MIYKKIGDKIPSLSGLLLSGLVLCSGCPDKNEGNSDDEQIKEAALAEPEKTGENAKGVVDSYLLNAIQKLRDKIMEYANLTPFKGRVHSVLASSDLELEKEKFLPRLKAMLGTFSGASGTLYPTSLKEWCDQLAGLQVDKLNKPYVLALAVNSINEVYKGIDEVFELITKLDNKAAHQDDYKSLKENKINLLFSKLSPVDPQYIGRKTFHDSPLGKGKSSWLQGGALARFMTDKNKDGKLKGSAGQGGGHDYGVPKILERKFSIWITNKLVDAVKPYHDAPIDHLSVRGIGISGEWKASDNTRMPEIHQLENGRLKRNLNLSEYFKEDQKYISVLDQKLLLPDFETGKHYDSNATVLSDYLDNNESKSLTGGSLVWLLFNGKPDSDKSFNFLEISVEKRKTETKKDHIVRFLAHKSGFDALINACKDDGIFAQSLGEHIKANFDLAGLVVIPNYRNLAARLGLESLKGIESTKEPSDFDAAKIPLESALGVLCKKIYEVLAIYPPSEPLLFDGIGKVGEIEDLDAYNESNVTFDQRVCIRLAKMLYGYKEKWKNKHSFEWKKGELITLVDNGIKDMLDCAIVFEKESGKYADTKVSRELRLFLNEFHEKLKIKHDGKSSNYKEIKTKLDKFDIDDICTKTREYLGKISKVSTLNLPGALLKEGDIESDSFPEADWFMSSHYTEFNKIKKEYEAERASSLNKK